MGVIKYKRPLRPKPEGNVEANMWNQNCHPDSLWKPKNQKSWGSKRWGAAEFRIIPTTNQLFEGKFVQPFWIFKRAQKFSWIQWRVWKGEEWRVGEAACLPCSRHSLHMGSTGGKSSHSHSPTCSKQDLSFVSFLGGKVTPKSSDKQLSVQFWSTGDKFTFSPSCSSLSSR